jgi:hypothetical protein
VYVADDEVVFVLFYLADADLRERLTKEAFMSMYERKEMENGRERTRGDLQIVSPSMWSTKRAVRSVWPLA